MNREQEGEKKKNLPYYPEDPLSTNISYSKEGRDVFSLAITEICEGIGNWGNE